MNYQKIYNQLIKSRINQLKISNFIVEHHHIIPRSFGGKDIPENLVYLSLKEHFFAHLLLYKIYKNDRVKSAKMAAALRRMIQSKKFLISSNHYVIARTAWTENHPSRLAEVKTKIKNSIHRRRLVDGWHIILCACGCGKEVALAKNADDKKNKKRYCTNHKPLYACACGCGELVTLPRNVRIPGHHKKVKCACGCGNDTYREVNINYIQPKTYCNGHQPQSVRDRQSNSLHITLMNMNKTDMTTRIKNSWGKSDKKKRSDAIRRGKGSKYQIQFVDGKIQEFWSYDDVFMITGYTYDHIKYRIKRYCGLLKSGATVTVIFKYTGKLKNE